MTNSVIERIATLKNIHLYRQILATIASCLMSLTGGIVFGSSAVLLPKLEGDPDFPYDPSFNSWIASISPFAMMFGSVFSGSMSDALGRKLGQIILIIPFTIGWFTIGFAPDNSIMLLGRFIIGLCTGAIRAVGMVYVGEVSDPKHRPVTLFCLSFAKFVGVLFSHIAGSFLSWRVSCFVFALPNIFCIIMLLFLYESPLWLLSKGRNEEGIEAFKAFRGEGEAAEKELELVLENQDKPVSLKEVMNIILSKGFAKSMMNILLLFIAGQFCGINTISFYALDIFQSFFSGNVDPFLFMIVSDLIRVFTSGLICLFAKKMPRRVIFLSNCYGTIIFLLCLALYLYIKPVGFLWVGITCLVLYLGIAGVLTSISWSFVSEIFPSSIRGLGSGISSFISFLLLFISVKITPGVMATYGDTVMYAGYAVMTLLPAVVLTFSLPETNGRSLQDIENTLYDKDKNMAISQSQSDHKPA